MVAIDPHQRAVDDLSYTETAKALRGDFMRLLISTALLLILTACNQILPGGARHDRVSIPFTPDISINEVMVAQIDHASHFIWEAADPDVAASSIDWQEVEHHAIQIMSSRSALSMGGTGVNDAMWITQSSWREYVNDMNEGAMQALASARAHDQRGLARAGNKLVESCESCHRQYKPATPTEGIMHPHHRIP